MSTELERAEQNVETRSESLKKPLGLFDLVLTQILFVVGSTWVGAAAKLGQAHLFFWLLAILLFYIPQAAVVIYLSNRMPLEGGIYQWAKLGFNEFAGFIVAWNLWLLSITVIALGGMFTTTNISYAIGPERCLDAEQQMVRLVDQHRVGRRSRLDLRPRSVVGQMASQCWRLRDVHGLRRAHFACRCSVSSAAI